MNRPATNDLTRYEIVITIDGSDQLIGYTGQHSALGIIHFISGRPALSQLLIDTFEGTSMKKANKNAWTLTNPDGTLAAVIRFSGRTQRTVCSEGELPSFWNH